MNKYIRALVVVPTGFLKTLGLKVFHARAFSGVQLAQISPFTEITLAGGKLELGRGFKMRDGAKIRIRKGAVCIIGSNTSVNSDNMIACHERITIGNNVQFSPNVQIYDHDHDFRVDGGIPEKEYQTAPVKIGNNVWVGANTVILRGTMIGDNCVIGAGSIVRGVVPDNSVFVQKRMTEMREIQR